MPSPPVLANRNSTYMFDQDNTGRTSVIARTKNLAVNPACFFMESCDGICRIPLAT